MKVHELVSQKFNKLCKSVIYHWKWYIFLQFFPTLEWNTRQYDKSSRQTENLDAELQNLNNEILLDKDKMEARYK